MYATEIAIKCDEDGAERHEITAETAYAALNSM